MQWRNWIIFDQSNKTAFHIEASEPKWVNPVLNIIGVNSLRLRDIHILFIWLKIDKLNACNICWDKLNLIKLKYRKVKTSVINQTLEVKMQVSENTSERKYRSTLQSNWTFKNQKEKDKILLMLKSTINQYYFET